MKIEVNKSEPVTPKPAYPYLATIPEAVDAVWVVAGLGEVYYFRPKEAGRSSFSEHNLTPLPPGTTVTLTQE